MSDCGELEGGRVIPLMTVIDDTVVDTLVERLSVLAAQSDGLIQLFLDTPGGQVQPALRLAAAMTACPAPVTTVNFGRVGGVGVHVLAAGRIGGRFALNDSYADFIPMHRDGQPVEHEFTSVLRGLLRDRTHLDDRLIDALEQDQPIDAAGQLQIGLVDHLLDRDAHQLRARSA